MAGMRYRSEIDGLRAVAVVPVILYHAGLPWLPGGYVGVDVFFVISGYLITSLLLAELAATGRVSVAGFYARRARRILPALFVVLLACLPAAWALMLPDRFAEFGASLIAVLGFGSNVYFWRVEDYFADAVALKPLIHTWSLAVEEQFYLAFPLLLAGLWRWLPRRALPLVLGLCAVASLALATWASRAHPPANFYLAPTRAWELLAGALAAFAPRVGAGRLGDAGAALGLALIAAAVLTFDAAMPVPGPMALIPVGGAVLVILGAGPGGWTGRFLGLRPVVAVGLVSYSAYLWHQPLFAFARLAVNAEPSPWVMSGLVVAAFAMAGLSWRYVERPFRRGLPSLRPLGGAVAAATLLAAFGVGGLVTQGAPGRMRPDVLAYVAQNRQDMADRQVAIRAGVCQFSGAGAFADVDAFLAQWDCRGTGDAARAASGVAVFGDSHADDTVVALRANGLDALQLAGYNCSVTPSRMTPWCRRLAERFRAEVARERPRVVWLANHFTADELTPAALAELAAYWRIDGTDVRLLAPTPEFPRLVDVAVFAVQHRIPARIERDDRAHDLLRESAAVLDGLRIVETAGAFCALATGCLPAEDGRLLMTDSNHLTVEGARRYGAALIRQEHLGPLVAPRAPRMAVMLPRRATEVAGEP